LSPTTVQVPEASAFALPPTGELPGPETLSDTVAPGSAAPLTVAELAGVEDAVVTDETAKGVIVVPLGATVSLTAVAEAAGPTLPAMS
jgi:hypothetical protein